MDEEGMFKTLMIACMAFTALAGVGTITLLVHTAMDFSFPMVTGTFLMAVTTVAAAWATTHFGEKVSDNNPVFSSRAEREVLNLKQRRELRRKRGEVVMERALVEVEQERDNIVHRALETANDPDKPPHRTQWTPEPKGVSNLRKEWNQ